MSNLRGTVRVTGVAVRAMLVLTLLLGVGYTLVVTGVGQLALPWQANGSLIDAKGHPTGGWSGGAAPAGSALIGQSFADAKGDALSQYFQPRPSAAGKDGYDPTASGGSNLGPNNPDLVKTVAERRAAIAAREHVAESAVPADAVTASASGLDPQISPAYALLQVDRVAQARGLDPSAVRALVESRIQTRDAGFLGMPRVNVLELNLALDALPR
ncbi:potassium translocating ATPase, subunit C [Microbacterium sp. 8M]|jgi:K+-transporting ATPase ATPase C chain|uniref:potassium-transporting ATPase subunit KdpC n=1 Tax=Microbacterium sp. 8M TaxID=2653153 RepID=UPI0012F293AE|nr:potassium-transporting ATPase subunit KdpC [Microbacterium sp. 8M]VXB48072.1 potassium translocating ATPase, subunit C [Microbacterium sp. 8M]